MQKGLLLALLAIGVLCTAAEARWSWGAVDEAAAGALRRLTQAAAAPLAAAPTALPAATAAPTATAVAPAEPAAAAVAPAEPAAAAVAPAEPAAAAVAPAEPAAAAQPAAAAAQPAAAAAAGEDPAAPKVFRPGVYVIEDPPPAPKVAPVAAAAAATPNVTGPTAPAPGKNLMVVMTVYGENAKDIYRNQGALRSQLATAAGVAPGQVYFYNQTANMDPRTGATAMSLVMNVDCTDTTECARAGATLYNTSAQTRLTDNLARSSISLIPGTFQVYGVNSVGRYKGNDTLYENRALTAPASATPAALDYNETMSRFATPKPRPDGTAPGSGFGNFTIPGFKVDMENLTLPTPPSLPGVLGNGSMFAAPGVLPGSVAEPVEPPKAKSGAGRAAAAAAAPLLAALAAALLL
ncbi:hypothetical protein HT031_006517 [Scenedesmus sp. PABB004]|nr:hypothetical protein HT031_006517 [Scenedesmus sp. PABB004]